MLLKTRGFVSAFVLAISSLMTSAQTHEFVPQWAKEVIWYQIFPERFRNGDPDNDPQLKDLRGADPQEMPAHWQIHPWGSDWYQLQAWEKQNGEPELWKHLLRRRYGGDLQGIIDKLPYLDSLGITAIYLNPIFVSPSLHKYDGESYHHVDPNFGPDPEGDRAMMAKEDPLDPQTWVWTSADKLALALIEKVHARGMRIIFDGVFNHMGHYSFAFADVRKNQQASPYRDWFIIEQWDDPATSANEFRYKGWFGVSSLPEFREDENGIVKGPREYIFAATRRWMNPDGKGAQYGIDGWRLDVAFCVDHAFWKDWRRLVKQINPEAYLTAEIVDKPEVVVPYMQGDEFDGEMNYNFLFACSEFFAAPPPYRISASQFDQALKKLRALYPPGVAEVSQNLLGSHDVNRIASHIYNAEVGAYRDWGSYFNLSKASNPAYRTEKPPAAVYETQKLMVAMQMTYPGAPMIYYGDEVGMWGANDPDNRKPMLWPDIEYEAEATRPDQSAQAPDTVEIDEALWRLYQKLIALRKREAALRKGAYRTLSADDEREVFGFERQFAEERIAVFFNVGQKSQKITLPANYGLKSENLISGKLISSKDVIVPARAFLILKNRP